MLALVTETRRTTEPTRSRPEAAGVAGWPDAWLVTAARREPPDEAAHDALDALVARHWRALYARCRLLASDEQRARDLAQDAWVRVLRARRSLDPARSFPAYLATIATNLWRDGRRATRRAGPLSDDALASLDAPPAGEDAPALGEVVPDPHALSPDDQLLLALDVDRALARLSPRARDVLVARYVDGESAAEIGRRYDRTEQTITAWLREATRELRRHLGDPSDPRSDR